MRKKETKHRPVTNGSKGVEFERVKTGLLYEITINPSSQPVVLTEDSILNCSGEIYRFVREHVKGVSARLWPELSPTGRLHYHGVIEVLEPIKYMNFVKQLIEENHVNIDTMNEPKTWYTYCTKQKCHMEDIFELSPLGYPMTIYDRMYTKENQSQVFMFSEKTLDKVKHSGNPDVHDKTPGISANTGVKPVMAEMTPFGKRGGRREPRDIKEPQEGAHSFLEPPLEDLPGFDI